MIIALSSSLHGKWKKMWVSLAISTWEKCVCAVLKVFGEDEGS